MFKEYNLKKKMGKPFEEKYGSKYETLGSYYLDHKQLVHIVDLKTKVPLFSKNTKIIPDPEIPE